MNKKAEHIVDPLLVKILGAAGEVTLGVSFKWYQPATRYEWIRNNGFEVEFTPDPEKIDTLEEQLGSYINDGIKIRHHAFFPGFEFGAADEGHAEKAMELHLQALSAMAAVGEKVVTCHAGITKGVILAKDRVVENLAKLVTFGQERGLTVCLENLRQGLTSDPDVMMEIVTESGASITLDVGHAVTCKRVEDGEMSVVDIVKMFSARLVEVHFYEKEYDRHYAPSTMEVLGPIVDELLKTNCRWWTVELEKVEEVNTTRDLVHAYLAPK